VALRWWLLPPRAKPQSIAPRPSLRAPARPLAGRPASDNPRTAPPGPQLPAWPARGALAARQARGGHKKNDASFTPTPLQIFRSPPSTHPPLPGPNTAQGCVATCLTTCRRAHTHAGYILFKKRGFSVVPASACVPRFQRLARGCWLRPHATPRPRAAHAPTPGPPTPRGTRADRATSPPRPPRPPGARVGLNPRDILPPELPNAQELRY